MNAVIYAGPAPPAGRQEIRAYPNEGPLGAVRRAAQRGDRRAREALRALDLGARVSVVYNAGGEFRSASIHHQHLTRSRRERDWLHSSRERNRVETRSSWRLPS